MNQRQWCFMGCVALVALAASQPYRVVRVCGKSMTPTYDPGAVVWATNRIDDLRKGDVVVIDRDGTRMIKRIAYLPGDGFLEYRIGGDWFEPRNEAEKAACERMRRPSRRTVIPAGMIYILGDGCESLDSRSFGPVKMSDVTLRLLRPKPKLEPSEAPQAAGQPLTKMPKPAGAVPAIY